MAFSQSLSNTSYKNFDLLKENSRSPAKKNALVRLKYIHNRILDHINMKRFMENHEVDTFLNHQRKLITNIDEIEVFRKKVKYMLLSIKDSILEFGEAISSGEVTFPSPKMSGSYNITSKKTSQSSSGVSTLGEISSLSSLALTNNNFQTLPNNHPEGDQILNELITQSDKKYNISSNNSNIPLSPSLNKGSDSFANSCSIVDKENRNGKITDHLQNKAYSIGLLENELTVPNKGEMFSSYKTDILSGNNASINLSSIELTNNNFQTLTNSCKIYNIPSNNTIRERERCLVRGGISEDLFTQPTPAEKNIKFKRRPDSHTQNQNIKTKKNNSYCSKNLENAKSENALAVNIKSNIVKNDDIINNLEQLTLGTPNNNIDDLLLSTQSFEKNGGTNSRDIAKSAEESNCLSQYIDFMGTTDDSGNSEIFFLETNKRNIENGGNDRENNNLVLENRSSGIPEKNIRNKSSQGYKHFTEKQSITKPNKNSQLYDTGNSQQSKHTEEAQRAKKYTVTLSEEEFSPPGNFSQISQSQEMCTPLSNNYCGINIRGIKRRVLDISSNLEMINGNIVSENINICSSVGSCPTTCTDRSPIVSDTRIRCNRDNHDLDKELEQAKEECSKTLNDLTKLLNETKKELLGTKNTALTEYCNGKLRFQPGYEHHYKHLDNLVFEFKTNIGLPSNIYRDKNENLFFDEAMNNWKELQQIVQKIKHCEKKFKERKNHDNT